MVKVRLTKPEMITAAITGVHRQIECLFEGHEQAHGHDASRDWGDHITGAAGEKAAAKSIDRYWPSTVNTFKDGGDLNGKIQVRTRSEHWHDLIVRMDDPDDHWFILVTGTPPDFRIHGAIQGHRAKEVGTWDDKGDREACWWVSQDDLTHKLDNA